jgi:DNA-binding response OmpR family regulator
LSKQDISAEDKAKLTLVHRNAKRLLHLVNQLLDLSKLEAGSLKLHVEQSDLSPFIKQLVSSFKYNINKKKIHFNSTIPEIKNVWFDKDALEKIITNLLSNAVKYTPKKGQITFDVTTQNNYVIITIINNSDTLDTENTNTLFTRYYRGKSNVEGTGIGLALVKELVTLSHGTIVANTIDTDQIQFTITLPIYKEAFNLNEINEPIKAEILKAEKPKIKHRLIDEKPLILIVEDDEDIRAYISTFLKDSYNVITAVNGKTGVKKALKNIPDLIVSDVMMPQVNGFELCNTLKQNELTSHIPIILLTGKGGDESEFEGLTAKADDFITKPFKSKLLVTRIANLIALRKALQSRYSQEINHEPKDIAITSLDEIFLNKVETILKTNLTNENFDAESFSKHMLMSRMQLHRKLKALTNLSTTEFLRSQRLKLAISILKKSDHSISEIAYQVGFSSPSYFNKCFKESYSCTPAKYRLKV